MSLYLETIIILMHAILNKQLSHLNLKENLTGNGWEPLFPFVYYIRTK